MAYFRLADDGLQVWCGLQIIGVRTAHEWFDGRLADGAPKEQFDYRAFWDGSDARQNFNQLVVSGIGPSRVNVTHVASEGFFTLHREPVQNGLRAVGTTTSFD